MNGQLLVVWLEDDSDEVNDLFLDNNLLVRKRTLVVLQIEKLDAIFCGLFVEVFILETEVVALRVHVHLHVNAIFDCVVVHLSTRWKFQESDSRLDIFRWRE